MATIDEDVQQDRECIIEAMLLAEEAVSKRFPISVDQLGEVDIPRRQLVRILASAFLDGWGIARGEAGDGESLDAVSPVSMATLTTDNYLKQAEPQIATNGSLKLKRGDLVSRTGGSVLAGWNHGRVEARQKRDGKA